MKRLLFLLLCLMLLPVLPAAAEGRAESVTIIDVRYNDVSVTITDGAFINWLLGLLEVSDPCDPPEDSTADDTYHLWFNTGSNNRVGCTIWYDDLYNQAVLTNFNGETHRISCDLPEMLQAALNGTPTFTIKDEHRRLLADYGWTIAFRQPCMFTTLPAALNTSRTDAASLHFTWADLFLRDAGYDITPWLGKTVLPYVYNLYETVNRVAWEPSDAQLLDRTGGVLCPMKAVVLEADGQVIGAYLMAVAWDGRDLMSLKGSTYLDLLGEESVRDYLLARLPMTQEERDMAALTPEEVIRRFGETTDLRLHDITVTLRDLGTAYSPALYTPIPFTTLSKGAVESIEKTDEEGMYLVRDASGIWFPRVTLESEETGWKIDHYYNSGP